MGGLALRPSAKWKERLSAQSRLHAFPNDFLQRPALRDHLYLQLEHGTRVEGGDRRNHGLSASRRMKRRVALDCFCGLLALSQAITAESLGPRKRFAIFRPIKNLQCAISYDADSNK